MEKKIIIGLVLVLLLLVFGGTVLQNLKKGNPASKNQQSTTNNEPSVLPTRVYTKAQGAGRVDLTMSPADSEVLLDGQRVKLNSGKATLESSAGFHTIKATAKDKKEQIVEFTVDAGKTTALNLFLRDDPKLGFMKLSSERPNLYWWENITEVLYQKANELHRVIAGKDSLAASNQQIANILFSAGTFMISKTADGYYMAQFPGNFNKMNITGEIVGLLRDGTFINKVGSKLILQNGDKSVFEITLKTGETFKFYSASLNSKKIAFMIQNSRYDNIYLLDLQNKSYSQIQRDTINAIQNLIVSPQGSKIALVRNDSVSIVNTAGIVMKKFVKDLSSEKAYVWLNNSDFAEIVKSGQDSVDQVLLMNPSYEGKTLLLRSFVITSRINLSKKIEGAPDENKLLLTDSEGSLWVLQPLDKSEKIISDEIVP